MTVLRHLRNQYQNQTALLNFNSVALTYADLLDTVDGISAQLGMANIGAKDVVAVIGHDQISLVQCILATMNSAICAPLDSSSTLAELEKLLTQLQPVALVLDTDIESDETFELAEALSIPTLQLKTGLNGKASLNLSQPVANKAPFKGPCYPRTTALILPSSGTTGVPKLIPLTQNNLLTSALSISESLQLTRSDRCLNVMPLYHIHGLVGALLATLSSGGSVICAGKFDEQTFIKSLTKLDPTWYTAVPTIHSAVTRELSQSKTNKVAHRLRFVRSCSSALHSDQFDALSSTFNVPVIEAYGMTEASHQIASNPLPPLAQKSGSVGLPCGAKVRLLDDNGNTIQTTNSVGEIAISLSLIHI